LRTCEGALSVGRPELVVDSMVRRPCARHSGDVNNDLAPVGRASVCVTSLPEREYLDIRERAKLSRINQFGGSSKNREAAGSS